VNVREKTSHNKKFFPFLSLLFASRTLLTMRSYSRRGRLVKSTRKYPSVRSFEKKKKRKKKWMGFGEKVNKTPGSKTKSKT